MNPGKKIIKEGVLILLLTSPLFSIKCSDNCLKCSKDPENYYLTTCSECKIGFFEYMGHCHACPTNCLRCEIDRKCIKCKLFHSVNNKNECVFSLVDVLVRVSELLIALIGVCMFCITYRKYKMMKDEEEVAIEIHKLERVKESRERDIAGAKELLDSSGLDYLKDVDDEGNVVNKKRGYIGI